VVLLFAIVGFGDVLQQTPRAVTPAPPPPVTSPPLVAVVPVTDEAAVVVASTGMPGTATGISSFPRQPVENNNIISRTIINLFFMIKIILKIAALKADLTTMD
jgi:hypothetical protein